MQHCVVIPEGNTRESCTCMPAILVWREQLRMFIGYTLSVRIAMILSFSDGQVWPNSADSGQTTQGRSTLYTIPYAYFGKSTLFSF